MFVHIIYEQFMHRQKSVAFLDCQIIAVTFLLCILLFYFFSVQRDLRGLCNDKQVKSISKYIVISELFSAAFTRYLYKLKETGKEYEYHCFAEN